MSGWTVRQGTARNEIIEGGSGRDLIRGLGGNDILKGRDGDDTLYGGTGDDRLYGGRGQDLLAGGAGYDLFLGGIGDDTLDGGAGWDKAYWDGEFREFEFYRVEGWLYVVDTSSRFTDEGTDRLRGIEQLRFRDHGLDLTRTRQVADLSGDAGLGFRIVGAQPGDLAGRALHGADVTGDGLADVLIGARGADRVQADYPPTEDVGEAYIVYGTPIWPLDPVQLFLTREGATKLTAGGLEAFNWLGETIAGVGDLDGDGIGDMVVAAPSYVQRFAFGDENPLAFVLYGRDGGFGTTVDLRTPPRGAVLEPAPEDTVGFAVDIGRARPDGRGADVNGDGRTDLILGSISGSSGLTTLTVLFGGQDFADPFSPTDLEPGQGAVFRGFDVPTSAGVYTPSVAALDINADGIDDLVFAGSNPGIEDFYDSSDVFVVFGSPGLGAGGPVDLRDTATYDGFRFLSGGGAPAVVRNAGDVNGDGVEDLLVVTDQAYVVFGGSALSGVDVLRASRLDGSTGFAILDTANRDAASAGDVNGDGYADILLGSVRSDTALPAVRETVLLFGGPQVGASGVINPWLLPRGQGLVIEGAGEAVAGLGDVNGDGYDDIALSDPDAEGGRGVVHVLYGGPGSDWFLG
ncbi:calcium-binding protein [Rhodocista pekingensis]|uniref:Calcium-binding protein n=1 Tax=Rhodocista pekingensis TaxID=201185 RepID=A0ABW2KZE9_9PROT